MFYNENYMQDLYAYNQVPMQNMYGGMNNMNGVGGMYIPNQMPNYNNGQYYQNNNLDKFYPATYRIIYPVVKRVVLATNTSYVTDDLFNNMVETVYNIVDGQILDDVKDEKVNTKAMDSRSAVQNNVNESSNLNKQSKKDDEILKDLIKILVVREIKSKSQNSQMMNGCQGGYSPYLAF